MNDIKINPMRINLLSLWQKSIKIGVWTKKHEKGLMFFGPNRVGLSKQRTARVLNEGFVMVSRYDDPGLFLHVVLSKLQKLYMLSE